MEKETKVFLNIKQDIEGKEEKMSKDDWKNEAMKYKKYEELKGLLEPTSAFGEESKNDPNPNSVGYISRIIQQGNERLFVDFKINNEEFTSSLTKEKDSFILQGIVSYKRRYRNDRTKNETLIVAIEEKLIPKLIEELKKGDKVIKQDNGE